MNNMEKYFDKARKTDYAKPPFSNAEIRNLLEKSSGSFTNDKTTIFSKLKWRFAMTAISTLIVAGVTLLLTLLQPSFVWKKEDNTHKNKPVITSANESTNIKKSNHVNNLIASNSEKHAGIISVVDQASPEFKKLAFLTDKELEALGIQKVGDVYTFMAETGYEGKKPDDLKKHSYDYNIQNGICRLKATISGLNIKDEIIQFGNWDVTKPSPVSPILAEVFDGKTGSYSCNCFGFPPLVKDKSFYGKEGNIFYNFFNIKNIKNLEFDKLDEKYFYASKERVFADKIPVCFRQSDGTNVIIWYVANKELISLLPERYRQREDIAALLNKYNPSVNLPDKKPTTVIMSHSDIPSKETHTPTENDKIYPIPLPEFNRLVVLSEKDLPKFGITRNEYDYSVFSESYYKALKPDTLQKYGYDINIDNGIYRIVEHFNKRFEYPPEIIKFTGWDATKPTPTCPVSASYYSTYITGTTSFGFPPLGEEKFYRQSEALEKAFYKKGKKKDLNDLDELLKDTETYPLLSKYVPVCLKYRIGEKDTVTTIFWFAATNEIISLLPDRYKKNYTGMNLPSSSSKTESSQDKNSEQINEHSNLNISGMRMLDLSPEELKKLRLLVENEVCKYIYDRKYNIVDSTPMDFKLKLIKHGYDTTLKKGIRRFSYQLDFHGGGNDTLIHYQGWSMEMPSTLTPLGITLTSVKYTREQAFLYDTAKKKQYVGYAYNDNRMEYISYQDDYDLLQQEDTIKMSGLERLHAKLTDHHATTNNVEWNPVMEKLVPVHILMGDKFNPDTLKIKYTEILLWFYPNEEFLNAIPENYSRQIKKELSILSDVTSGKIPYEEACKGLEGQESFFGICRLASGALRGLLVYPTPAHGKATCKFSLSENRKVSISLYDLNGKFITTLINNKEQEPGEKELPIELNGFGQGAFMLAVTTDKGEQVVQRIIIQ